MSDEEKVEEALEQIGETAELSEGELEAVAGGFCIMFGLHDGADAECGDADFYACAYLGLSFGGE